MVFYKLNFACTLLHYSNAVYFHAAETSLSRTKTLVQTQCVMEGLCIKMFSAGSNDDFIHQFRWYKSHDRVFLM